MAVADDLDDSSERMIEKGGNRFTLLCPSSPLDPPCEEVEDEDAVSEANEDGGGVATGFGLIRLLISSSLLLFQRDDRSEARSRTKEFLNVS